MKRIRVPTRRRLVAILACGLAVLFAGAPAVIASSGTPKVTLDATTHEFGRVPRGTVVTKNFVIGNTGTAPLSIEKMQFSTPGMRARVAALIEPGRSVLLQVEWDTSHYSRDAEGQVVLELNDPATPKLVITLAGFVVSPIEVEPVPAFYLSQFHGDTSAQTVTIRNNRDRSLRITGTERQGESFSLALDTIEPGRVYKVTATALPDLAPGEYRESALLFTDDPEQPKIRLEVNILVKRDVHASIDAIDMGQFRITSIRTNPSQLDLLRQTVILEARSADMRITKIESDLPFVTLRCEPESPAKRVTIDVGLDPDRLSAGAYSGSVRIHTSLESTPVVTLPIRMNVMH